MFKFAGIIFALTIFFAANAAPPSVGGNFSSLNWVNTNVVHNLFGPAAVKLMAPVIAPNPPSANAEEWQPPVAPQRVPVAPITTWASLDGWATQHGLGKPHFLSNSPVTSYAIGSSNGVMVLTIGSREATWNGIEIHLGFQPQIIDGEVFVQGRDLQKNLEPLLCEPPLAVPQTRPTIVIDPGHGGANVGTHSILDGRFEKEFTLDWAKRLAPLLEQEGWQVFLTRTSDTYVTNASRVTFAEEHHADFFISLHFNSLAPDKTPSGIETYCVTPTGMPSTLTRGYGDFWSETFPNNTFDVQNLQLAIRLEGALLHATGMEDRGVCRARFMEVLRGQHCPAVLIEAGFLSNPGDARQIETPEFRQKLAQAVADALRLKPEAGSQRTEIGSQKPEAGTPVPGTNTLSWP
ncbi:MAG: N-acetylmuramoyl-L-alanine amidase [Verrucomicrobiia bacterium]